MSVFHNNVSKKSEILPPHAHEVVTGNNSNSESAQRLSRERSYFGKKFYVCIPRQERFLPNAYHKTAIDKNFTPTLRQAAFRCKKTTTLTPLLLPPRRPRFVYKIFTQRMRTAESAHVAVK